MAKSPLQRQQPVAKTGRARADGHQAVIGLGNPTEDFDAASDQILYGQPGTCYQKRSIETAQVMEELVEMAKKFREVASRGEALG